MRQETCTAAAAAAAAAAEVDADDGEGMPWTWLLSLCSVLSSAQPPALILASAPSII